MMKNFKALPVLALMANCVSALENYYIGDSIEALTDVLGFNVLSSIVASYDIIYFIIACVVAYLVYRWFRK